MERGEEALASIARAAAEEGRERTARAAAAAEIIRRDRGYRWVGLYDVLASEIAAIAWTGEEAPEFPRFPIDRGLCGAAVSARAPVIVGDVMRDPRYLTTFGSTRSEMIVPVIGAAGAVRGLIDVESERLHAFKESDRQFLQRCAAALIPLWEPA